MGSVCLFFPVWPVLSLVGLPFRGPALGGAGIGRGQHWEVPPFYCERDVPTPFKKRSGN